jgi:hypothetical protein
MGNTERPFTLYAVPQRELQFRWRGVRAMRGAGIVFGLLAALPLAGCFGVTIPPKPLPEWAMQPQAELAAPSRQRMAGRQTPRTLAQRRAPDQSATVSYVGAASGPAETKPFSPEWAARENALDDRLRRRMHICGGC